MKDIAAYLMANITAHAAAEYRKYEISFSRLLNSHSGECLIYDDSPHTFESMSPRPMPCGKYAGMLDHDLWNTTTLLNLSREIAASQWMCRALARDTVNANFNQSLQPERRTPPGSPKDVSVTRSAMVQCE